MWAICSTGKQDVLRKIFSRPQVQLECLSCLQCPSDCDSQCQYILKHGHITTPCIQK